MSNPDAKCVAITCHDQTRECQWRQGRNGWKKRVKDNKGRIKDTSTFLFVFDQRRRCENFWNHIGIWSVWFVCGTSLVVDTMALV